MKMPPVPIANIPNVGKGSSANMKSAVPPSRESDALTPMGASTPVPSDSQKGGCLYESLATAAYQLAPPAVLLGIAAATLRKAKKTRRGRKAKKTKNKRRAPL
jgi:hypothetical protein